MQNNPTYHCKKPSNATDLNIDLVGQWLSPAGTRLIFNESGVVESHLLPDDHQARIVGDTLFLTAGGEEIGYSRTGGTSGLVGTWEASGQVLKYFTNSTTESYSDKVTISLTGRYTASPPNLSTGEFDLETWTAVSVIWTEGNKYFQNNLRPGDVCITDEFSYSLSSDKSELTIFSSSASFVLTRT